MKKFANHMMSVTHILFSQYGKEEGKMKIKSLLNQVILIFFAIIVGSSSAYAIPSLQLDIKGGTYDALDQSIFATSNSFTLYALLLPGSSNKLDDDYYISAALRPITGEPGGNFGSFMFDKKTVSVTGDMEYGTPPLYDYLLSKDPGDLSQHGIFNTYFTEFGFKFNDPNPAIMTQGTTQAYNSQDSRQGPTLDPNGNMYFQSFKVDTSGLAAGYSIHFDLYNKKLINKPGDIVDVNKFAPFSHDANSTTSVPEPGTLLLLGLGLIGLSGVRRITNRKYAPSSR